MQTQPTPISQIVSPNATPGPANRSQPPAGSGDGDFQRTLNRQLEQRQASRTQAQAARHHRLPHREAETAKAHRG